MMTVLLSFEFKDILNWVGGLVAFALFFVVAYYIGQLGVQIRSGIKILNYINKAERASKVKGMSLNEKGIALKKKGKQKIYLPSIGIIAFYACVIFFTPTEYHKFTLILLLPVILGFFGFMFVPEQLSED